MVTNADIARMLNLTADLLEIKGENPFKVRAYRNAARLVENSSKDFNKLVKEGFDLTRLPGIGNDLSTYIKEIVTTGKFSKLEKLKKEVPVGLIDMLSIEGLGPKRIKQIYDAFGVTSLDELRKYAESGELERLSGFGPVLIQKILKGIKQLKKAGIRFLWAEVEEIAEDLREYLLNFDGVEIVEIAGSYRRKKETVGDLDILVIAEDYMKVSEYFIKYKRVKEVHSAGLTRSTVFLDNNLQVDLRAVNKESYGAALHYFTGSKSHNIEIRKIAIELGMKVNEYGVYKGDKKIAGRTEEEVYEAIGLCYIEPELRENRGEIEACKNNSLPELIKLEEIKGDFHIHSNYSLGENSIEEIVKEAIKRKYRYIAITDFNLDEESLKKQIEEINVLNEKYKRKIKIFTGIEAEILEDGNLNANEKILEKVDIVICAIKDKFELDSIKQTKRVINALQNPYLKILAHPTCRIINKRNELNIDYDKIFEIAKNENKILEINSQPNRLDLNDVLIKRAKEIGVKLVVNSDAKNINELKFMKYGINQARRGWAEKENIINCLNLRKIIKNFNI